MKYIFSLFSVIVLTFIMVGCGEESSKQGLAQQAIGDFTSGDIVSFLEYSGDPLFLEDTDKSIEMLTVGLTESLGNFVSLNGDLTDLGDYTYVQKAKYSKLNVIITFSVSEEMKVVDFCVKPDNDSMF